MPKKTPTKFVLVSMPEKAWASLANPDAPRRVIDLALDKATVVRAPDLSAYQNKLTALRTLLNSAVLAWPAFDRDDDVSGADLVDWFYKFRNNAKKALEATK